MLTSKDVRNKAFTPTQFHTGYDEREVDDFLDQASETLHYYEQGGRPDPQAVASTRPSRDSPQPTSSPGEPLMTQSLRLGLSPEAANLLGPAASLREPAGPHRGGLVVNDVDHGEPA